MVRIIGLDCKYEHSVQNPSVNTATHSGYATHILYFTVLFYNLSILSTAMTNVTHIQLIQIDVKVCC